MLLRLSAGLLDKDKLNSILNKDPEGAWRAGKSLADKKLTEPAQHL